MYQCSKKLVKYKEYSCFDHSDFLAQSLYLMYAEVGWVLVSSGTQVQLQILLNPDYQKFGFWFQKFFLKSLCFIFSFHFQHILRFLGFFAKVTWGWCSSAQIFWLCRPSNVIYLFISNILWCYCNYLFFLVLFTFVLFFYSYFI